MQQFKIYDDATKEDFVFNGELLAQVNDTCLYRIDNDLFVISGWLLSKGLDTQCLKDYLNIWNPFDIDIDKQKAEAMIEELNKMVALYTLAGEKDKRIWQVLRDCPELTHMAYCHLLKSPDVQNYIGLSGDQKQAVVKGHRPLY